MTDSLPSYKCPFGMNKDQDILWRLQKRFQYFQKQKKKKVLDHLKKPTYCFTEF